MPEYRMIPVTADDYRRLAIKRLPRFLFDYIDGGSGEEISMGRNRRELQEIRLEQRVMRDVGRVDTRTDLLGQEAAMPLPVGGLYKYRRTGELHRRGLDWLARKRRIDLDELLSIVGFRLVFGGG